MAPLRSWLPCWCWIQIMDLALGRWIVQDSTDLNSSSWPSNTWSQQSPENFPLGPEDFPTNFQIIPEYAENSHKNTQSYIRKKGNFLINQENLNANPKQFSGYPQILTRTSENISVITDKKTISCSQGKLCTYTKDQSFKPFDKYMKISSRTRQSTAVYTRDESSNETDSLSKLPNGKKAKQASTLQDTVSRRRKLLSKYQHRKFRSRDNVEKKDHKKIKANLHKNFHFAEESHASKQPAPGLIPSRKLPETNTPKATSRFPNISLMREVYTKTFPLAALNLPESYSRKQLFEISSGKTREVQLKGEPNLQEIDLNDASAENPGNGFDEANSSSFQAHGLDQVLSEETISVSSTTLPAPPSTDVNASFPGTSSAKLVVVSLRDNSASHDDSLESVVKTPPPENFSISRKNAASVGNSFNARYGNLKKNSGPVRSLRNYLATIESPEKYTVTKPGSFFEILDSTRQHPTPEDTQTHKLHNNCSAVPQRALQSGKILCVVPTIWTAHNSSMNFHSSISGTNLRNGSSSNSLLEGLTAHDPRYNHRRHWKREVIHSDVSSKQLFTSSAFPTLQTLAPSQHLSKWDQSTLPFYFSDRNSQALHFMGSQDSPASSTSHASPPPPSGAAAHRHRKRGAVYASVVVHDSRLGPGMGGSAVETFDSSGLQRFATEPAPQTAVLGSTVVLPCRVMNKVGHLQWTKDGFGLGNERRLYGFARYSMIGSDDEGDFSLRIQPVQLEDDGHFQCQVSASDGVPGIRSEEVQLTVYVPPDPPVVEPVDLETTTGLHATLKCTSRGGRPPPEIQWIDDRHPREPLGLGAVTSMELMEDNKRSVVTSTLTFVPRRTHDNSTITCITSHQALTSPISRSARVRVQFAPEVQVSAHPARLVEGDDAHFVCQAEANPPQLTYKWFHNSVELENQTSQTLTLPRISRDMHKDTVSCEVSNKVGASKKTLGVHVRYGPVFRSLPVDAAAEPGQEVMLRCSVDANPQASIVWLQEGDNKIIGTGSELRVSVSPVTAGAYRCVAGVRERDLQFPELIGRMKVLLKGPPTIVSDTDQMGRPGATVNLECNTVSVPSPIKVTWTYKGKPIDLEKSRYEVVEEQRNEGLRTILVIRDADKTDFGDYNCSVVNEYGIDRKLIRLNEEKRVPLVLVIGCAAAVVVSVGLLALCVICSKRLRLEKASSCGCCSRSLMPRRSVSGHMHRTIRFSRDSPEPEKIVSSTSGPPNMYSGTSDARMADGAPPSPSQAALPHDGAVVNPGADDGSFCGNNNLLELNRAQRMKGSFMQDGTSTFSPQLRRERREDHSVYLPLINMGTEDQDSLRRSSLSGMSAASAREVAPSDQRTPDFCTMRRGVRGPDITLSHHHLANNGGLALPPDNGSVMSHHLENCGDAALISQPTNGIRHSGENFMTACETYVRHVDGLRPANEINHHIDSGYSPYSPYGPSPPYPRSPQLNGGTNTSGSPRTGGLTKERPTDVDYIYSSGAVLKPGTLV